jgi:hypothetical protein
VSLASADAEADREKLRIRTGLQGMQTRHRQTRSGTSERMTERNRSTIDVDRIRIETEVIDRRLRHRRKRFVDLVQVELAKRNAELRLQRFECRNRTTRELQRTDDTRGATEVASENRPALGFGNRPRGHDDHRATVADLRTGDSGEHAGTIERSLQSGDLVGGEAIGLFIVPNDRRLTLALRNLDLSDLRIERTMMLSGECLLVAPNRESVHLLTSEAELPRPCFGGHAHRHAIAGGVLEAVRHRCPLQVQTGKTGRLALGTNREKRRPRHALHTTGHGDLRTPGLNVHRRKLNRLRARPADLVHAEDFGASGTDAAEDLVRHRLATVCRNDTADDAEIDARGIEAETLDRGIERNDPQIGEREGAKHSILRPDRGPSGRNDDDVARSFCKLLQLGHDLVLHVDLHHRQQRPGVPGCLCNERVRSLDFTPPS